MVANLLGIGTGSLESSSRPPSRNDVTDKIEHSYTFIERREWVNRRSWPRKTIGHRGLSSIFRSLAIRSRLPLGTFVGNVTNGFFFGPRSTITSSTFWV